MANQGMFGPSGAEVELAIREQQNQEAMQMGQQSASQAIGSAMASAGQSFGRAIEKAGGYEDPRIAKANLLEEAKMEVDSSGADLMADPKGYYGAAFKALQSRGLTDEAMSVRQLLISEEASSADSEYKRAKAKELDGKGRYQKVGAGGLYDTETDTLVAAGKTTTDKPNSPIGKLKKDYEDGLISKDEFEAGLKKATHTSSGGGLAAVGAGLMSLAEATREKKQGEKAGALSAQMLDRYGTEASDAMRINQSLTNIESALETGDTTFGSLADTRRNVLSFVETFIPGSADSASKLLKLDITSFDSLEKEGTTILADMAKEYGGNRATAMGFKILSKAGPSVFLTNEGNAIVAKGLRKRNQYKIDRAQYIYDWQKENVDREMPSWMVGDWELKNSTDPKYTLTPQDMKEVKTIVAKTDRIKRLARQSVPVPLDPASLRTDKIYRSENETGEPIFLRWDARTNEFVDAD